MGPSITNGVSDMPKIEIETCSKTPNYCALEAIAMTITQNYTLRFSTPYRHESVVTVTSGRVLKVVEAPYEYDKNAKSPCESKYKVTLVDK